MDNSSSYELYQQYRQQYPSIKPKPSIRVYEQWKKHMYTSDKDSYYNIDGCLVRFSDKPNHIAKDKQLHNRYNSIICSHLWNDNSVWIWKVNDSTESIPYRFDERSLHLGCRLYCINSNKIISSSIIGSSEYWDIKHYIIDTSAKIDNGIFAFNCFGDIVGPVVRISTHKYILIPYFVFARSIHTFKTPRFLGLRFRYSYGSSTVDNTPIEYMKICMLMDTNIKSGDYVLNIVADGKEMFLPHDCSYIDEETEITIVIGNKTGQYSVTINPIELNIFKLYNGFW